MSRWLGLLESGQYDFVDDATRTRSGIAQLRGGPRVIVTYIPPPAPRSLGDLAALDGPRIAPLLGIAMLPPYGHHVAELEPPGAPITIPLPVDDVVAIAADLADILAGLHARGHTLGGAFLDPEVVYLEGCRLSAIAPRGPLARARAARAFRGNYNPPLPPPPHLFSPEAVRGLDAGPPADVFSLCACLHWWITDRSMYGDHAHFMDVLRAVIDGARVALDLPAPLAAIVDAGTAKDPASRLSAADLSARLRALASH